VLHFLAAGHTSTASDIPDDIVTELENGVSYEK
jgi:hypothetical protein